MPRGRGPPMRCSGSQTTFTAADGREAAPSDANPVTRANDGGVRGETVRSARDVAAALMFREILEPLAQGLGPLADVALATVADDLALGGRR